jgi:hypothetical protein
VAEHGRRRSRGERREDKEGPACASVREEVRSDARIEAREVEHPLRQKRAPWATRAHAPQRGGENRSNDVGLMRCSSHCSFGRHLYTRQIQITMKMVLGVRRWRRRATSCRLNGERTPGAAALLEVSVMAGRESDKGAGSGGEQAGSGRVWPLFQRHNKKGRS